LPAHNKKETKKKRERNRGDVSPVSFPSRD